ncbi:DUF1896 family protein [Cytophagaceae bacterium DM2B3-1]|uniref:DUF1896 family protein n=2 Tax=Xanthocytophaga TaxID=3078918 RepID=A0ABT7CIY4_9BACT|nr:MULTISPECIES: DUF1896 family protein [Xanthocytophaga]MDJ1493697.1 DUF1896 family protein [Xanthocytophaga flavus]MDJ1503575.1 DUF1896 family protein [Xanthocytophaga agilis]
MLVQDVLIPKLWRYISENNPDLLAILQQEGTTTTYFLEKARIAESLARQLQAQCKPTYFIEEQCLNAMTSDLRPSRFNYLKAILEEEFESDYQRLSTSNLLTYEVINLIEFCQQVFEEFGFSEATEDSISLRNAIIGSIQMYWDSTK